MATDFVSAGSSTVVPSSSLPSIRSFALFAAASGLIVTVCLIVFGSTTGGAPDPAEPPPEPAAAPVAEPAPEPVAASVAEPAPDPAGSGVGVGVGVDVIATA